jgi:glycosyltransferase involved in cell wall biosynthesis
VPRSEIHRQFSWADVFLLPSICEGSATVCYEALSFGLPVITTPNTGSVVRDGIDGFVVPIRNTESIIEKLVRFDSDRDLLALMSRNARQRSADFTVEKYGERLLSSLGAFNSVS